MWKLFKKFLCLVLIGIFTLTSSLTAFATEVQNEIDSYTIEGKYVKELVDLSADEIIELSLSDAKVLFEEAFIVPADNYTEDEIRLVLDGLAFGLKFQEYKEEARKAIESKSTNSFESFSTTDNTTYSGSIGVSWIRDTRSGKSPLTLGEILSGTYTLEVDYLTWDTASAILAASANYNAFQDLVELVLTGATGTALSAYICSVLGITGGPATVTSLAVGTAVGFGWNWIRSVDRSRMYNCFVDMNKSKNQYMKVQFMWSSNMVNRFYSTVSKTCTITNPFPGTYGDWNKDTYGYMYSY